MKRSLLFAALALAAVQALTAAEAPPVEVKHTSSFKIDASGRNPFWPIGWQPAAKTPTGDEHGGPDIPESAFLLTAITLDNGTRFAIINGKAMQEGQQFGLKMGAQTFQLSVKRIEDGRVILLRRGQEIAVLLHRK